MTNNTDRRGLTQWSNKVLMIKFKVDRMPKITEPSLKSNIWIPIKCKKSYAATWLPGNKTKEKQDIRRKKIFIYSNVFVYKEVNSFICIV